MQINSHPIITNVDKRKRPLDDVTSRSQQNKRFNSFGNDIQKAVNQLICKHKLTDSSGQQIVYIRSIYMVLNLIIKKIKFILNLRIWILHLIK